MLNSEHICTFLSFQSLLAICSNIDFHSLANLIYVAAIYNCSHAQQFSTLTVLTDDFIIIKSSFPIK